MADENSLEPREVYNSFFDNRWKDVSPEFKKTMKYTILGKLLYIPSFIATIMNIENIRGLDNLTKLDIIRSYVLAYFIENPQVSLQQFINNSWFLKTSGSNNKENTIKIGSKTYTISEYTKKFNDIDAGVYEELKIYRPRYVEYLEKDAMEILNDAKAKKKKNE